MSLLSPSCTNYWPRLVAIVTVCCAVSNTESRYPHAAAKNVVIEITSSKSGVLMRCSVIFWRTNIVHVGRGRSDLFPLSRNFGRQKVRNHSERNNVDKIASKSIQKRTIMINNELSKLSILHLKFKKAWVRMSQCFFSSTCSRM